MATAENPKLWEHPNPTSTAMWKFMQQLNRKLGLNLSSFEQLYQYSITSRNQFWDQAFQFFKIIHTGTYSQAVDEDAGFLEDQKWFHGIQLNLAENMLYSQKPGTFNERSTHLKEGSKTATIEIREGTMDKFAETWDELRSGSSRLARAMKEHGLRKGDRIAAIATNSSNTLKVFLASTSLGGIFTSMSPDMGVKGILERLKQITPKYIFMDDGGVYNNKDLDFRANMAAIVEGVRDLRDFKCLVALPRFSTPLDVSKVTSAQTLNAFLEDVPLRVDPFFERVGFNDPAVIVYSSGTTGTPKCIVHTVGGILISSLKENTLHRSMDESSVSFTYATTSWIMYLALIVHTLNGSTLILYDGSPFFPSMTSLLDILAKEKVTHFGTSPRYLLELQKKSIRPRDQFDLSALEMVACTGAVLPESQFRWFYEQGFPKSTHLCNLSGGTDICGSFACGNPLTPVYAGTCQGGSLGTPISIFDSTIEGEGIEGSPTRDGTPGELVATAPFPNVPLGFWGDVKNERFQRSYLNRFKGVWTHGDMVLRDPNTKQIVFLGRSDGILNPSGVRFGPSEIYSVLEGSFPEIQNAICVGQRRPGDEDERVLLFVLMAPGTKFGTDIVRRVKAEIARQLSKRHVPAHIFAVPDIPTTTTGKKVELPVKYIVCGEKVKPSSTLANPESLNFFYRFADDKQIAAVQAKL